MSYGFKFATGTNGELDVISDDQVPGLVLAEITVAWVSNQVTSYSYPNFEGSRILVTTTPINAANSSIQAAVNQATKTVTFTCRTGTIYYPVAVLQYRPVFATIMGF